MPRVPRHALVWSAKQELYEWSMQGQVTCRLQAGDEAAWLVWLSRVTSLAFHGRAGSLNVYQEQRPRGGSYWYAYHTDRDGIHKRYLGPTDRVTLARLEATAQTLQALSGAAPVSPRTAAASRHDTAEPQPVLLAAKLTPPRPPRALIERPRLLAALDGAHSTPLTLLSAAAGWGKTTLLSTWASRQMAPVAWLSLDELENGPSHFWEQLIAALRRCGSYGPDLGETALALLQSPQPPALSTVLLALVHELESREARPISHLAPTTSNTPTPSVALILDDYQVISEPAVHESLRFFLEHLPTHLHVILSSRVDPDMPLARLRARGALCEIRMDDLRFREEEARHFLGQLLTPALSEDEADRLTQRTEGWVAGLQLAALALQKRADRADRAAFLEAFTGHQRYLLDYVQEDILAHLPTPMRDFLLQIAILSRLDAEVCQVVTGEPDRRTCQQQLEALERANLFLVPLDEERRWYRLHDLFREALLAALEQTRLDRAPALHRRAASYFEVHGQWAEAIVHRLAAADFESAVRLMEQAAEQLWERGEATMLARWVLALPQSLVRVHARLALTTALYLLYTVAQPAQEQRARIHQTVRQLMARVEAVLPPQAVPADLESSPSGTGDGDAVRTTAEEVRAAEAALLHWRLRLLRLEMANAEAIAHGDFERVNGMQDEIEEALDRVNADEEAIWQLVPIIWNFLLHYTVHMEGARILPQLLEAKARVSQSANHLANIKVRQFLAMAAVEAGQLCLAYEESQAALDLIEQIAGYTLLKGYFEVAHIEVLYQWNRLEEARGRLHTMLHDTASWQQQDLLGLGYFALMQVELARGDQAAAEQALRALEDLVRRERYGALPSVLSAFRALWFLAQGKVTDAAAWAAGVVFHDGAWENSLYFNCSIVIQTYFAQHRWREALALLERWSGQLDRPANIGITITYLAQLLVALHQTGQRERARETATRLFALTEPEGYIRVYLDLGEPMRQALLAWRAEHGEGLPEAPSTMAYVAKLLAAFERDLPHSGVSQEQGTAGFPAPTLALTLTAREQEVLRLLAEGASNREIAQTLMIELSTVKKHVSNLLGKLGAANRTRAIAQARARSLL